MFRNRNFSISALLMFVLGFTLFGTTVLIPLFVQQMMGYTAEQAGLVISPGGLAILVLMPMVGFLVGHVDNRYLIAIGFAILSAALYALRTIDTQASYSYVAWMRIFQASGLAFLFVPINTSPTPISPVNRTTTSPASPISPATSAAVRHRLVATMLARRAQFHQDRLSMFFNERLSPVPPVRRRPRQSSAAKRNHVLRLPGPRPRSGQHLPAARPAEHPARLPRRHRHPRHRHRLHDPPRLSHEEAQAGWPRRSSLIRAVFSGPRLSSSFAEPADAAPPPPQPAFRH